MEKPMRGSSTRRSFVLLTLYLTSGMLLGGALPRENRAADPSQPPSAPEKYTPTAKEMQACYQRAGQAAQPKGNVYKAQITPHWSHDNTRFWYRNDLAGGAREFILVDVETGKRRPAFDHKKLAAALSRAAEKEYHAERLPFDSIEFAEDNKAVRFKVGSATWKCDLSSYQCSPSERGAGPTTGDPAERMGSAEADREDLARQQSLWPDNLAPHAEQPETGLVPPYQPRRERSDRSPDDSWTAFVKENNVFVRNRDGKETQLTADGKADLGYGMLSWAPDSKTLVASRIEPEDRKEVYLIESSPRGAAGPSSTSGPTRSQATSLPPTSCTSLTLRARRRSSARWTGSTSTLRASAGSGTATPSPTRRRTVGISVSVSSRSIRTPARHVTSSTRRPRRSSGRPTWTTSICIP